MALLLQITAATVVAYDDKSGASPSFYKDVLPILQARCQNCHNPDEIGPMPLLSYQDVRPWAAAIREAVKLRKMPPWFADPAHGEFANNPRLSDTEIKTIDAWVEEGASPGVKPESTPPTNSRRRSKISPEMVITVPQPIPIPA